MAVETSGQHCMHTRTDSVTHDGPTPPRRSESIGG
jgi:hypothetical protein